MLKSVEPVHFKKIESPTSVDAAEKHFISYDHANYSAHFGLKRVGAHHFTLKPGYRSSHPHAESHEEEFVYVISGTVHAWLNGYLYEMKAGWSVGFPAGTGIAHTFINNSSEDVQLLVVGERTKKENLCSFPCNPEMKETVKIWWENSPIQSFGPHPGTPGSLANLKTDGHPAYAAFVPDLALSKAFHYPGDNETFDVGVRLTDQLGLKALGIWFMSLPPGRRTCYPHAHTHEEEFAFILSGTPKVWLAGKTHEMTAGEAIGFASNTGISHCMINDSESAVTYIGIGETAEFKDEKITYPLNPLRRRECELKGSYWTDAPSPRLGSHTGRPEKPIPNHMRFLVDPKQAFTQESESLIVEYQGAIIGSALLERKEANRSLANVKLQLNCDMNAEKICRDLIIDYARRALDLKIVNF